MELISARRSWAHSPLQTHRSTAVLAKYLVANEIWQSLIGGCNNDRWPNDTC